MANYEVLAKATKKDYTSLVAIICCTDGVCYVVPKDEINQHSYTNGKVGKNGKLYLDRWIGRPVLYKDIEGLDIGNLIRVEVERLLGELRR